MHVVCGCLLVLIIAVCVTHVDVLFWSVTKHYYYMSDSFSFLVTATNLYNYILCELYLLMSDLCMYSCDLAMVVCFPGNFRLGIYLSMITLLHSY